MVYDPEDVKVLLISVPVLQVAFIIVPRNIPPPLFLG